jgi:hypothetical protein
MYAYSCHSGMKASYAFAKPSYNSGSCHGRASPESPLPGLFTPDRQVQILRCCLLPCVHMPQRAVVGDGRLSAKDYALQLYVEQYSHLIEHCWGEASNKFRDRFYIQ